MAEDARVCSPSGAPGGWCAREAADCAARCALEVEYAAEASHLEAGDSSAFSFQASLTVVNNEGASLRAWQATWAFAEGEGVARDAAFATDVAVLVSPGGPGGQPARLVNALGEGGAVPPAGRRRFAFPGVASGVSTALRSVARVHLNGARCVAIQEPPRIELEEPDEPGSFASGHDDDVHDDVDANEPLAGASFASCPPDAGSFFRFCCGETKTSLDASDASESSESVSLFANASSVVSAALVVVASALVLALLARLARAVARHFKGAFFSARTDDAETRPRKTTAFLPGQVASAPAADLDGIVVRSSNNGVAVGRDGRTESVRADRRARRDPSSASSRSASSDELKHRRRSDSGDSGSDAADGADALVVVALSEIELGDVLGRGAYGVVRRGVWRRKSPYTASESEVDESEVDRDRDDAADAADASDDAEDGLPSSADGKKLSCPWTSTRVAVKTLRAARLGTRPSRGALRAFKREVAVLSRLRHPCVVRLLGACLTPPDLCIVEELVEGGSLHAYLHGPGARRGDAGPPSEDAVKEKLPSVSSALDVCFDVARAMAYLAARGVTHRDLKSQNVLLVFPDRFSFRETNLKRRRLRAKVADFGIAKSRTLDAAAAANENAFLATNGTTGVITGGGAAGTPAWMAPELFRDAPVADQASDAYSFGVVLWECLTGKTPWGWLRDPIQIVFAVAVEGKRLPLPPRVFRDARRAEAEDGFRFSASAEETTRALLERCWAEDPRDRPGFEEIGEVLRGLRASADESRGSEARAEP